MSLNGAHLHRSGLDECEKRDTVQGQKGGDGRSSPQKRELPGWTEPCEGQNWLIDFDGDRKMKEEKKFSPEDGFSISFIAFIVVGFPLLVLHATPRAHFGRCLGLLDQ